MRSFEEPLLTSPEVETINCQPHEFNFIHSPTQSVVGSKWSLAAQQFHEPERQQLRYSVCEYIMGIYISWVSILRAFRVHTLAYALAFMR